MTNTLLNHEVFGNGPELVVYLHEFFGSLRTWDPIRRYLDRRRRTHVFADVPGYGGSRRLEGPFEAERIHLEVNTLVDALNFDRFHLVGHSMNGRTVAIALNADACGPQRIMSGAAITPVPASGLHIDAQSRDFFRETIRSDDALTQAISGLTSGRHGPSFVAFKVDQNRRTSNSDVMEAYLAHLIFDPEPGRSLQKGSVNTPLLMVNGRFDMENMREQAQKKTIPESFTHTEWVEMQASGHYPMDEEPAALATVLEGFWERVASPKTST
ncbi:MAG: alpha/beta fold hydrolase [Myxococcota bacterium]